MREKIQKIIEGFLDQKPQIKLKGWWWKRFFKKYRNTRDFLQGMLDREHIQVQRMIRHGLIYGFPKSKFFNPWGIGVDELKEEMEQKISEVYNQ